MDTEARFVSSSFLDSHFLFPRWFAFGRLLLVVKRKHQLTDFQNNEDKSLAQTPQRIQASPRALPITRILDVLFPPPEISIPKTAVCCRRRFSPFFLAQRGFSGISAAWLLLLTSVMTYDWMSHWHGDGPAARAAGCSSSRGLPLSSPCPGCDVQRMVEVLGWSE